MDEEGFAWWPRASLYTPLSTRPAIGRWQTELLAHAASHYSSFIAEADSGRETAWTSPRRWRRRRQRRRRRSNGVTANPPPPPKKGLVISRFVEAGCFFNGSRGLSPDSSYLAFSRAQIGEVAPRRRRRERSMIVGATKTRSMILFT